MLVCPDNIGKVSFDRSSYNILIVEDSKFVNRLLFDTFSKYGYSARQSHTLAEAREALAASDFDLIILDLHLPDGDGEELIEEMKNVPETKIIVLTADDDQMMREHIYHQGVLDYFNKDNKLPYTISLINNLIEEIQQNSLTSILIIDDSSLVRKLLTTLLSPRNYHILTANNGEDGLKIIKEEPIDLVILDMELPDIHGTKVLNQIKSDITTMQTEVVVLSGTSEPNIISTVLKQGACSFIKKPFSSEELIHSVDTWINYLRERMKGTCHQQTLQEYKNAIDRNSIVSVTNPKGIITFANENFCKISGYTQEELVGQPHNIVRHPDEDPAIFKNLWETIQAKKPWSGTVKNLAKDGHTYYVDVTISPISNFDGSIKEYLAVRHDITQMKQHHQQLTDELKITTSSFEEATYLANKYERALLDTNLIFRTDKTGIISYVNHSFTEKTGFSLKDIKGKHVQSLLHKDNNSVINEINSALSNAVVWKGEIQGISKDSSPYCLTSVATPITNSHGEIEEYIFINHDITQIKNLNKELQEKDEMISMQSRHAAMGEMISMITHQWKQPLSAMSAISNRIQMDVALEKVDPENMSKHAIIIEEQVQYLAQTIDDFKNFFKPSKTKEMSKITDVVEHTMKLIGKLITDNQIDLVMNLNADTMVDIYPKELLQVFINLLKNAVDAFEGKNIENKRISIKTEEDDKQVTIEIQDNAGGIPQELMKSIFDPYFTTKPDDQGTGLGLHICKTIIEKHMGGNVSVSNKEDGACFIIQLLK